MLRQLALAFAIVLVGSSALASSIGLVPNPSVEAHPLAGGESMGALIHRGMSDPRFEARVEHWLAEHGLDHPQRLDLGPLSPVDAAKFTLNHNIRNGRSVAEWVTLAKAENLLALSPSPSALPPAPLADEIARLDAAVGFPLTAEELATLRAQTDALPAEVREPFAALVAATADAYVAQTPVANAVVARLADAEDATDFALTADERETTLANALALVAAQNAFRAAVADVDFVKLATPAVSDPNGLVFLGSSGDDTYGRDGVLLDPVLVVDPAGNDLYENSAGGACPDVAELVHACNGLVASMVVDLMGDDRYAYEGRPAAIQGAGSMGAVGVLVDVAGEDSYYTNFIQPTSGLGPLWGGVLGYIDAGSQGFGMAGAGIILDATGNDVYEADITSARSSAWVFAQGFGNAAGLGIASDGTGDDEWLSYGFDAGPSLQGFQGLYPGGTGFFGGLGILAETGLGNDEYHAWDSAETTDFYAYGFGAFGGTGIFYEDGGDDNYEAVESATDPFIVPLLNCAYGTASFAGLGVFLEMGGNDVYFGDSISPRRTATMNEGFGGPAEGEGVFIDVSGDDGHFMEAHSGFVNNYEHTYGRGAWLGGGEGLVGNTVGIYLDMMGDDEYTGAAPSGNNRVWPVGMDFEAGSIPEFFDN